MSFIGLSGDKEGVLPYKVDGNLSVGCDFVSSLQDVFAREREREREIMIDASL